MIPTFDKGDRVRLEAELRDLNDVLANGTVVLKWRFSDDVTETEVSPTNSGTGLYHYDLDITRSKINIFYRWVSTGAVVKAGETMLAVRKSQFA